jgi:hypothetical protein
MIFICCLTFIYGKDAYSQNLRQFDLGSPSGNAVDYNPVSQYLKLYIVGIHTPKEEDPSWIENSISKIFLKRKQFGIGYVEVTLGDRPPIKTVAFTYEKTNGGYKYESIAASEKIP